MYKTNYLFSVEELKKKMPDYSELNQVVHFKVKSYSTPGFKWITFFLEVVTDPTRQYGILNSVTYYDASRNVGDGLLSTVHHYGHELFYEITKDCRVERLSKDGNLACANSYGKKGFFSEKLPENTTLDIFSITTEHDDKVTAYYSQELGGFLYHSTEINKAIVEFKTSDKCLSLSNLSRWNFSYVNKLYLHDNEYYYFVPYDLNEHKQFNVFTFNKNIYSPPTFSYADKGRSNPMSDVSILELKKKFEFELEDRPHYKTEESEKFLTQLRDIVSKKTVPFTLRTTEFLSDKVFMERSESFSVNEIVSFVHNNENLIGKIISYNSDNETYTVETFKSYLGSFVKEKKHLKKVEPFKEFKEKQYVLFRDFRGKKFLFGEVVSESSLGIITTIDNNHRFSFFSYEELKNEKVVMRLSTEESLVFEQFLSVQNHNEQLIRSIIDLTRLNSNDLTPVFYSVLNAMLSCMSIESVIKQVVTGLDRYVDDFERRFIPKHINIFKKILLTRDVVNQ